MSGRGQGVQPVHMVLASVADQGLPFLTLVGNPRHYSTVNIDPSRQEKAAAMNQQLGLATPVCKGMPLWGGDPINLCLGRKWKTGARTGASRSSYVQHDENEPAHERQQVIERHPSRFVNGSACVHSCCSSTGLPVGCLHLATCRSGGMPPLRECRGYFRFVAITSFIIIPAT